MALIRLLWKRNFGKLSHRAVIVCTALLGFLLVRAAPLSLQRLTHGSVSHSLSTHDHKQFFDHDDFQWLSPPRGTLTAPTQVASSHLPVAAPPHVDIVTDGWHYNRPPPLG
jgi:hypothetical protein